MLDKQEIRFKQAGYNQRIGDLSKQIWSVKAGIELKPAGFELKQAREELL